VFRPLLSRSPRGPWLALTLDDGPDPSSTPQFLDELRRLRVPATFFVLGAAVRRHPALARRIAAEGHEIGVHGWTHRPHLLRTPAGVAAELYLARAAVVATAGVQPTSWRPPHGVVTGTGLAAGAALGMSLALWTVDGADWAETATPASVLARIRQRLSAGSVVLLHDSDAYSAPGSWKTALAVVEPLVNGVRASGCDWRRLDGRRGPIRSGG
jgi:peptidoglycan/xylan/chitin deacetylase (PgdA/CDA1 family)